MLSTPIRLCRVFALWSVTLASACLLPSAAAQSIDVSLNVLYNNPLDPDQSGGKWQIVAKSSAGTFGIEGLDLYLTGVVTPAPQPVGPHGTVNGNDTAGFSELTPFIPIEGVVELIIGQTPEANLGVGEEQSVFYGVGTLTNGAPNYSGRPPGTNSIGPTFTSLTDVAAVPWATVNVFGEAEWNTAALLATGTFLPGFVPAFYSNAPIQSSGTVYTSLPATSTTVGNSMLAETFSTIVRSNEGATPDYNLDGLVNAADYTLWRDSLGRTGPGLAADGNRDGAVDVVDYDFWKANFGLIIPGSGGGSAALGSAGAVPEPATPTLWLGAAILLFLRRKNALSRCVRFP